MRDQNSAGDTSGTRTVQGETMPGRVFRLFTENIWQWVGLTLVVIAAAIASQHAYQVGGPAAFYATFVAALILYTLLTPRMTVYGRPVGVRWVGWGYRKIGGDANGE